MTTAQIDKGLKFERDELVITLPVKIIKALSLHGDSIKQKNGLVFEDKFSLAICDLVCNRKGMTK